MNKPESIEDRQHYVYVIFRPNGVPCYIGKGRGNRWEQHERKSHNIYLDRIIKKAGGSIPKVKIREGLTEQEAFETEVAFIAAIGRISNGAGPLVNMTDGGDGVVGHKRTDEQRARMSADRKGKSNLSAESRAKISAALKGREKSPEHCAAVSAAKKGVLAGPMSQAQREAIGAAHRGRKCSPEEIEARRAARAQMSAERKAEMYEKIRKANTGKKHSEETRRKLSDIQKGKQGHPCSPETKAAVSAARKGKPLSEEHREKLKAAWALRRARTAQVEELENAA